MKPGPPAPCAAAWEALRGDPLAWLLDDPAPNLRWRVLADIVGRPADSLAVRRARSGANVAAPVAALLSNLSADGSWSARGWPWTRYRGHGWRMVAAVQLGADPADPRLNAGVLRLMTEGAGCVGVAPGDGQPPLVCLTARVVQMLAGLGWQRQPCFHEALAWLDEGAPRAADGGWGCPHPAHATAPGGGCAVTAVSVLAAAAPAGGGRRMEDLRRRAVESLLCALDDLGAAGDAPWRHLGHPNLLRTDEGEMLWSLAVAGEPFDKRMGEALRHLQAQQDGEGRWLRGVAVPGSLPVGSGASSAVGERSRWVTLRAATPVLRYVVEAGLPRLFPQKPVQK